MGLFSNNNVLTSMLSGLKAIWPVVFIFAAFVIIKAIFSLLEMNRLAKSGINEIDKMDGKTFEKYLEALFVRLGYSVERTQYVGDYGADLITRKTGVKTVIQAKRYKQKVGIKAVQEAVAAKGKYDCTHAMVITNSFFTKQAIELARANKVELWNRDLLVKALLSIKKEEKPAELPGSASETAGKLSDTSQTLIEQNDLSQENQLAPNDDVCSICGNPVSEKVKNFCIANSTRFDRKIYCFEHQRNR